MTDTIQHGTATIPIEFWNDPLYKNLIKATTPVEYEKARDTLLAIRGSSAIESFRTALNKVNYNKETYK